MNRFEELIEEYRSIQLAKSHLDKLQKRLINEKARLTELTEIIKNEYEDVIKFEQFSLKGLFSKLLIDKSEQYEIEKQEYLLAVLQFSECEKIIELLKFEEVVILEKVKDEREVKNELERVIQENRKSIAGSYPHLKNELHQISELLDRNISFRRELEEALLVSTKAGVVLENMIKLLEKASRYEDWGYFYKEIQRGKKIKKSYLDQAHQLSYTAKQLLQELEDELEDIFKYKSIVRLTKFEEFRHFNDIYHDRLISDWIVKHEVTSSINSVQGTADSVQRIIETLKIQLQKTKATIEKIYHKRKMILLENIR